MHVHAYADNITAIRAKYDMSEPVLDSLSASSEYESAAAVYAELREDYDSGIARKTANDDAIVQLQGAVNALNDSIEKNELKLDLAYDKMVRAINAERPLTEIYKSEQQYLNIRQLLTRDAELLHNTRMLIMDIGIYDSKIRVIDEQYIIDSYEVMSQMKATYDESLRYEDIGEVRGLKVPTSNGVLRVNSPFGGRPNPFGTGWEMHYGLDLPASYGDTILAAFNGKVAVSQFSNSYGWYVIIDHGYGVRTLYAHASENLVSVGDEVTQYQDIQKAGSTGRSTGPHLHFEVAIDGERVDPLKLFS